MSNPVKDVRTAHGLTQLQMAEKLGCGHTTLRRLEYESRLPENKAVLHNLRKLAKQKGIQIEAEKETAGSTS